MIAHGAGARGDAPGVPAGPGMVRAARRQTMSSIPHDPALDSTLSLMREGYEFIWNRCRRFDSDLFTARVMGRPVVCIHGREAAELFYDARKLERGGALPRRVVTALFGRPAAVHTLDDDAHRR